MPRRRRPSLSRGGGGKLEAEGAPKKARIVEGLSALVLGATGFIGTAVCSALVDAGVVVTATDFDCDHSIPFTGMDMPMLVERVLRVDVTDFHSVMRAFAEVRPDLVFHLAAMSQVGPSMIAPLEAFRANALGTVNVLEACRITNLARALILASTDKVYGDWGESLIDERAALRPRHPYDASKAAGDLMAQAYAARYGLPIGITRCGNVYGPGDTAWDRLVPGTIRSLMDGKRPVIRSDGQHVREFNYVGDIAEAYIALAEKLVDNPLAAGAVYTVSSGDAYRVIQVVEMIQKIVPGGAVLEPIIQDRAQDETPVLRLDSSRFRGDTGWEPEIDLEEGLTMTADWLKRYMHGGEGTADEA